MAFTATVIPASPEVSLRVLLAQEEDEEGEVVVEEEETPPNPILPVGKEIIWGFGSFLVLLAIMRYLLFPPIKKGMDARAARISGDHATAERVTAEAEAEVSEYEAQVQAIRAEGQTRVDAARAQLDSERQARLGEVSTRLSERRGLAAEDADAARRAALGQVTDAVADVASAATAHVLGRPPDPGVVRRIANEVVGASSDGAGAPR